MPVHLLYVFAIRLMLRLMLEGKGYVLDQRFVSGAFAKLDVLRRNLITTCPPV